MGRTVGQRREFAAKWALDSRLYGNGSTRGWLVLIALMSTSIGAQPRDRSPRAKWRRIERAKWRRIERAKWRRCAHELSEGVAHGTFAQLHTVAARVTREQLGTRGECAAEAPARGSVHGLG